MSAIDDTLARMQRAMDERSRHAESDLAHAVGCYLRALLEARAATASIAKYADRWLAISEGRLLGTYRRQAELAAEVHRASAELRPLLDRARRA